MHDNNLITSRYNNGDYIKKNKDWHAGDSLWKANQIDKIIKRNNLKLNSICEIGCGAGEILKQIQLKDMYKSTKLSGYEISDDAYALCKKKETDYMKFFKTDLLLTDKVFDCVLCIDVFEHVENYIGFIKDLKKRGKYKIFHIPLDLSVSSLIRGKLLHARNTVGHLHYFTPETSLATLKDCGYEIVDSIFTPSFSCFSNKNIKSWIAKIPRNILYFFSPKITSTILGGVSLMVLAK